MKKLKSALIKKNPEASLKETYEKIYKDKSIWKFSKFDGVHAIIWKLIEKKLNNSSILDVGCGAGRLSFYLALKGERVLGIDFSTKAIEKANFLKNFLTITSVEFRVDKLEKINEKFDIIVFADVIEHVKSPLHVLKHSYNILNDNGFIVFSCPGFMNLRGIIYKTLLNTLKLPMSLADLRQVNYLMVKKWSRSSNFKIEKIVGGLYNFGWGNLGVKDLIDRLPKVLQDKPIKEVNLNIFNKWLKNEKVLYDDFLIFLLKGHLKKLSKLPKLKLFKPEKMSNAKWNNIKKYLINGFRGNSDSYYCEDYPFNLWGGETIYLLKKL